MRLPLQSGGACPGQHDLLRLDSMMGTVQEIQQPRSYAKTDAVQPASRMSTGL